MTKSRVEHLLEVRKISDSIFQSLRPQWHPPKTRGLYGGCLVAQCLVAAQKVVPPEYLCHSMHGYFVFAGRADEIIQYNVNITRKGRTFITAQVDAIQSTKLVYTTILSFARDDPSVPSSNNFTPDALSVFPPIPTDLPPLPSPATISNCYTSLSSPPPFLASETLLRSPETPPHLRRKQIWLQTHGSLSPQATTQTHLAALALMTDCYYISSIAQLTHLHMPNFNPPWEINPSPSSAQAEKEQQESGEKRKVGMIVSLDHTVYFHEPRRVKADEWIYAEMQPVWAGKERGLAMQRMWAQDGRLLVTSVQEGMIRLDRSSASKI